MIARLKSILMDKSTLPKIKRRKRKPPPPTWSDNMAEWLDKKRWSFWTTFTTPYEMSTKSARRLMERTHKQWQALSNNTCTIVYVMEPNELRDGYHLHALVDMPVRFRKPQYFHQLVDSYQAMTGARIVTNDNGKLRWDGYARLHMVKYDNRKRTGYYMTKYMTKKNGIDNWDILI